MAVLRIVCGMQSRLEQITEQVSYVLAKERLELEGITALGQERILLSSIGIFVRMGSGTVKLHDIAIDVYQVTLTDGTSRIVADGSYSGKKQPSITESSLFTTKQAAALHLYRDILKLEIVPGKRDILPELIDYLKIPDNYVQALSD